MTLSKPKSRRHVHTRTIECFGYHRDDGLWDIEVQLTDTKTYSFDNEDRGGINAGEPIHKMLLRITLDSNFLIQTAEASTEASPYHVCPSINSAFYKLKGLRISPGWRREVLNIFGGIKGCTHLTDLLMGPVATTAFQTIRGGNKDKQTSTMESIGPRIVGKCHALASDGPIVKREWPELFSKEKNRDSID